MNKTRLLWVLHDASRTGAPLGLLNTLRWLKTNQPQPVTLLLKSGGPLVDDFEQVADVQYWDSFEHELAFGDPLVDLKLIIGNTTAVSDVLTALHRRSVCPIITCVRELEYNIKYFGAEEFLFNDLSAGYIADSKAVKQHLIDNYQITPDKIEVVYEGVTIDKAAAANQIKLQQSIRKLLRIPHNAFVVASCGSVEWRKGADIFLDTARLIQQCELPIPVHFIWIGSAFDLPVVQQLHHDVAKLGLTNNVHFIGPRINVFDYLAASDAFAMLSREEPLSIAMLEAASLGKPIICFAGSGGPPEFVEQDAGYIVPYRDSGAVARAIEELIRYPSNRLALGQTAAKKVNERFGMHQIAKQCMDTLEHFLLKASTTGKARSDINSITIHHE